ncbi:serine/threonine protein phosphatase 1 [Loktanella fryxellensis]|uniref:Serine/threonine protein phosphatase 1 n=1 Tax=Loktanella fryxellensis TaxID=245187 RepID=A0A1H8GYY3_9RHOB|nr:metallophosphoesterase [Loktanella fryxellensis]SEN49213.1 serine/threonine protein phosphatase 1 [Loktanella fryxellensis]
MKSLVRRLLGRPGPPPPVPYVPPAPDGILSVVGDVHGCAAQMHRLLAHLPGQIVLVGDIVDRGENVRRALELALDRPEVICLRGNHEEMLLNFLDDPLEKGPAWLRHGGLQTLASYGVKGDLVREALPHLRDALMTAMGDATIAWLRNRPLLHVSGTVGVTHAGADPARPLAVQDRALVWGHPDCARVPRQDGMWIVQGHVIVPVPDIRQSVIFVDTGAYAGGRLSAVILGDGDLRFVYAP